MTTCGVAMPLTFITVGGILLAPHFLSMVGATGEIKAYGIRYLRVIFIGSLFVSLFKLL